MPRSISARLALSMVGLGLATGAIFPFFVLGLGVDADQALTPSFFAATLAAGTFVGGLNSLLSRAVLGGRLKLLSGRMRAVADAIRTATALGDWRLPDELRERLPDGSPDELGESARAFNALVDAVDRLHALEAELAASRTEALTDDLTGLGNRRRFSLAAESRLRSAPAGDAEAVGVLLVDLDRFKEINDTLGHHAGDDLLRQMGQRLQRALPDALVLARLGGDEFVALVRTPGGTRTAVAAAEAFTSALDEPFLLDGTPTQVRASVGIAVSPQHGDDRDTLLRRADRAMYRAKACGGGIRVSSAGRGGTRRRAPSWGPHPIAAPAPASYN